MRGPRGGRSLGHQMGLLTAGGARLLLELGGDGDTQQRAQPDGGREPLEHRRSGSADERAQLLRPGATQAKRRDRPFELLRKWAAGRGRRSLERGVQTDTGGHAHRDQIDDHRRLTVDRRPPPPGHGPHLQLGVRPAGGDQTGSQRHHEKRSSC